MVNVLVRLPRAPRTRRASGTSVVSTPSLRGPLAAAGARAATSDIDPRPELNEQYRMSHRPDDSHATGTADTPGESRRGYRSPAAIVIALVILFVLVTVVDATVDLPVRLDLDEWRLGGEAPARPSPSPLLGR